MTPQEKETFCRLVGALFSPPDLEIAEWVHQRKLASWLERIGQDLGADETPIQGFFIEGGPDEVLKELRGAYDRLFLGLGEGICPVESYYKPWTRDPHCSLSFAGDKGLLMGDSALHLMEIYRHCHLEVSDELRSCPDHLILEIEFLSYLYRDAGDREIKRFIEDHLDWIPLLKEEFEQCDPHPFYRAAMEILDRFLQKERTRLNRGVNGEKKVH